jgi:hypothetical protein
MLAAHLQAGLMTQPQAGCGSGLFALRRIVSAIAIAAGFLVGART